MVENIVTLSLLRSQHIKEGLTLLYPFSCENRISRNENRTCHSSTCDFCDFSLWDNCSSVKATVMLLPYTYLLYMHVHNLVHHLAVIKDYHILKTWCVIVAIFLNHTLMYVNHCMLVIQKIKPRLKTFRCINASIFQCLDISTLRDINVSIYQRLDI